MQREWQPEELIEQWTLLPKEEEKVCTKRDPARLGFAVLLKYFQYEGRFPAQPYDVPKDVAANVLNFGGKVKRIILLR